MKKLLLSLAALVVIVLALLGIIKLVPNLEYILGFLSLSFALLAVIWTFIANHDLAKGSSLRQFASNFLICAIFLLFYSGFQVFGSLFGLEITYLGYSLISIGYLALALAAYRMLMLGKEFGFKSEVKKIKRRLKKKR